MTTAWPHAVAHAAPRSVPIDRRVLAGCVLAGLLLAGAGGGAQTPPPRPGPRLAEAQRALTRGDLALAFELGSAYVKAHPRDAQGRLLLARVHIERGELDQAYDELDRALRADPRNVDVLAHLGLVSGHLAAMAFERLATEAPGSARVLQLQGETFEAQERRKDAETAYQAALDVQPDLLDALLPLAKLKRIRLACEEAVVLYDKAEAIRPTFEGAYGLGVCHSTLQNDELAVTRFQEAVARDPDAAVAWAGLGTSLVKLRRTAEGIEKLEKAVALEPAMAEAHYMLGLAYQTAGDGARSAAAFKKAEDVRPR